MLATHGVQTNRDSLGNIHFKLQLGQIRCRIGIESQNTEGCLSRKPTTEDNRAIGMLGLSRQTRSIRRYFPCIGDAV